MTDNPIEPSQPSQPSLEPAVPLPPTHRKLETGQIISSEQSAELNRYMDPGAIIDRLVMFNWNPDAEISEVVEMAKQDDNLNVKIRDIQYLSELVTDSMTQSGMIATLTQSSKDGNMSTTLSTKVVAGSLPYYEKIQQMKQVEQKEQIVETQKGDTNVQTEQEEEETTEQEDTTCDTAAPGEQSDNLETGLGDHKPPTVAGQSQYPGISTPTSPDPDGNPEGGSGQ